MCQCVTVCDDNWLKMIPKNDDVMTSIRKSHRYFKQFGPSDDRYINDNLLVDMMLKEQTHVYTGGAGTCAGCGEGTALRMMCAATVPAPRAWARPSRSRSSDWPAGCSGGSRPQPLPHTRGGGRRGGAVSTGKGGLGAADMASAVPLLSVAALTVRYGGVVALDSVSLSVPAAGFVGLIGPNGAGKTTFVDALTGFTRYRARSASLAPGWTGSPRTSGRGTGWPERSSRAACSMT